METTSARRPNARLLLPQAHLSGCIFGAFVRDIRGCDLPFDQRFNHFGSSPLCAITWTYSGTGHLLQKDGQASKPQTIPAFPDLAFSGPYQTPQTSWSNGEFYAMTLAFYPDAFAELTGINPSDFANRTVPAEHALSGEFLEILRTVAKHSEAEPGFDSLQENLAPLWAELRPKSKFSGHLVSDWCKSLLVRAAFSELGISTRQLQRRIKSWSGHSKGQLMAFVKGETAFKYALNSNQTAKKLDLADMAQDLGYSDQSHMGRHIKEITGFSPAEFMRRYEDDETFWSFRLLGMRY